MATESRRKRKREKRRRWPFWVAGIFLFIIIAAGAYAYYLYAQLDSTVNDIQDPLESDQDPEQKQEVENTLKNKETLNFLLLGVDERQGDSGRSDTMIFLSANPNTESILMLSIPRDSLVEIPGRGQDKINHAYAFGGTDLAVKTVQNVLDVPIHFYAKVNMEGFKEGVNALGGVTVQNEFKFTQGGETFPAGELHLNGEEALKYARMRKEDPDGDFGRTERQRQVLQSAMNKAASFSGIGKVNDILNVIGDNVRTNMDMGVFRTLLTDYRQTRKDINNIKVEGQGGTLSDGIWYYQVPEEEWNQIHQQITEHMNATSQ